MCGFQIEKYIQLYSSEGRKETKGEIRREWVSRVRKREIEREGERERVIEIHP